ncbi:MAG: MerR family transcriptional regulator [Actinomycetota bacterium]
MENLVPIGRFSKMTRLSVKALRHYDQLGLLVPAVVDRSSGYRYYTFAQANRAEAIRVLRSLDMPLEDVREALAADDPVVAAKVLDRHRARLEVELERHERMLGYLQRLIERKEGVMPYEVQVKEVPPQQVAAVRMHTSIETIGNDVAEGFGKIGAAVGKAGIPFAGPPLLIMFDVLDEESGGEMELAFPVAKPFPGEGEVFGRELEGGTMAWTMHSGPYDEIGPAYHTLTGWIQEHGHEIAGPSREVYLTDPSETPDPADYLTEVQFPIR